MSIFVYPYSLINNHIFIHIDNKTLLIDSGSPVSIGEIDEIKFAHRKFRVRNKYYNISIDKLRSQVKCNFHALIGCDILNNFDIVFKDKNIIIYEFFEDFPQNHVKINDFLGVPIVPVNYRGKKLSFFFDTGSWLTYFNEINEKKRKNTEVYGDFYPIGGFFTTPVFDVFYEISQKKILIKTGILPAFISKSLIIPNVDGILGFNFFDDYTITYSYKKKMLAIN